MFLFANILSEVRISDQIVFFLFPLERSRAYSLRSLHRDRNTGAIQRDRLLSGHVWAVGWTEVLLRRQIHSLPFHHAVFVFTVQQWLLLIVDQLSTCIGLDSWLLQGRAASVVKNQPGSTEPELVYWTLTSQTAKPEHWPMTCSFSIIHCERKKKEPHIIRHNLGYCKRIFIKFSANM